MNLGQGDGGDPDEAANQELLAVLSSLVSEEADGSSTLEAMQTLQQQLKDPSVTPPLLDVETLLALAAEEAGPPLLDVRSPGEFAKGRLPGAKSMPLFSDVERAEVGTTYSQCSREKAMVLGMSLVRPKLEAIVGQVGSLLQAREGRHRSVDVLVYCWRGGMRSGSVAWFLRRQGLRVRTLKGGYKAFRTWALARWGNLQVPRSPAAGMQALPAELVAAARALPGPRVCVICGRAGSGKTRVLHALRDAFGKTVIDLEGLANHRGSSFGWCGHKGLPQPTSEHFSNRVAHAWHSAGLKAEATGGWVFVEDKEKHVGNCEVPHGMYAVLRCAPLTVRVVVGEAARLQVVLEDYAGMQAQGQGADAEKWAADMEASIKSLGKRLGGNVVKALVAQLRAKDYAGVAKALLDYYDRLYDKQTAGGCGAGSGNASQPGAHLIVEQDATAKFPDAVELARGVLARVADFEAANPRPQPAPVAPEKAGGGPSSADREPATPGGVGPAGAACGLLGAGLIALGAVALGAAVLAQKRRA